MQISSLSLLIQDRHYAMELSELFKKMGVVSHYYEDLEEFWFDHLNDIPTLAIVDVESLSKGTMSLADHPQVKAEKLPLVFVYRDDNGPLVLSCHSFFHFGFINRSLPPGGQLKSILRRVNKFSESQAEGQQLRKELEKSSEIIARLQRKSLDQNMKQKEVDEVLGCLPHFQDFIREGKPAKAVQFFMDTVSSVEKYSLIELSVQGRKLYSSEVRGEKNTLFPKINLKRTYAHGIDEHLKGVIKQMGFDLFGHQTAYKFIYDSKGECRAVLLYLAPAIEKETEVILDILLERSWDISVTNSISTRIEDLNIYDLREVVASDQSHHRIMGFKWKALLEVSRQVENSQIAWEKLETLLKNRLSDIFDFPIKLYFDSNFNIIIFSLSHEGEECYEKVMTLLRDFSLWDLVDTQRPYSLSHNKALGKRLPLSMQAINEFLGIEFAIARSTARSETKTSPVLDQ